METNTLILVLSGLLVISAAILVNNYLRSRRRVKFVDFCLQNNDTSCGTLIGRLDYQSLKAYRFTLCVYFRRIIDQQNFEQLDALYWSWQAVDNQRKKELCREIFQQAVILTKSPILVKVFMGGLLKTINNQKPLAAEALLTIIKGMTLNRKQFLFLEVSDLLTKFAEVNPESYAFTVHQIAELQKELCV